MAIALRKMTLEEYLDFEERSPHGHEYRDGIVYDLAAPSRNHADIAMNLSIVLGRVARNAGCMAYAGDMKLVTPSGDRLIPDFSIRCPSGRDESAARGENVVTDPWLVVEILSPSTAVDDVTEKLAAYQSVSTITHYIVVDSRRRAVRVFERTADGKLAIGGAFRSVRFPRLSDVELTLDDIYRDTTVLAIEAAEADA